MSRLFTGGSSDLIDIGTWALVVPKITIACWVKIASWAENRDDRIVSKASGVTADSHVWMLGFADAGTNDHRLRMRSNNNGATALGLTNLNARTNEWIHICGTSETDAGDGNELTRSLYVDGASDSGDTVNNGGGAAHSNTADAIYIGNQPTSTTSAPDGRIAEVGIWTVKLEAWEIAQLAAGAYPYYIRPRNLVCYYPLDRGDSPEKERAGGVATLTGTVTGATFSSDHPPMRGLRLNNYHAVRVGDGMGTGDRIR